MPKDSLMILKKDISFKKIRIAKVKYGNVMVVGDLNIENISNRNDAHDYPFGFDHDLDLNRSVFRRL